MKLTGLFFVLLGLVSLLPAVGRPNILFAISDDQSYPHTGANGCDWVKTPTFDRIAEQGLLFRNCYTSGELKKWITGWVSKSDFEKEPVEE